MRSEIKNLLSNMHEPREPTSAWKWATENVDFGLAPAYETPLHQMYDADFMPYWKEPVENEDDPDVDETWVLKPSRAGGSENLILNPIRKHVAVDPAPLFYVSGDQKSVERFMENRIKLGLRCSTATAKKLDEARDLEHEIYFDDMSITTTWPKAKTAFKQSGYKFIYGDEISLWPGYSPDMLRKRGDTYPDSHVMGISSLDPQQKRATRDDPIMIEFLNGDQRYWNMPDPKTGNLFQFEMGSRDDGFGLMWSPRARRPDGTWDLDKVRQTAYYKTPDGTKITNKRRLSIVNKGRWIATNDKAPKNIRSYHLNAFYLPFKSGDFGTIAAAFLSAKARGTQPLRVFIYEYLSEIWKEDIETAHENNLYQRCRKYPRKGLISECKQQIAPDKAQSATYEGIYLQRDKTIFVAADVQWDHFWINAREWIRGGDSGLIDWSYAAAFEDIEEFANEHKAERVVIDYGYERRRWEVFEYALKYKAWPLMGRDNLSMPFLKKQLDPREGKKGQGKNTIKAFEFQTDIFGTYLLDAMRGESEKSWYVYNDVESQYVKQAASMERVEGVWQTKHGHSQNHLWDCEVMQLVMATIRGFYRMDWAETRRG